MPQTDNNPIPASEASSSPLASPFKETPVDTRTGKRPSQPVISLAAAYRSMAGFIAAAIVLSTLIVGGGLLILSQQSQSPAVNQTVK